jgi:hypothetical protein
VDIEACVAARSHVAEKMTTERDLVRVATFNINNINKRLDNLLAWLSKRSRTWLVSKSSRQSREPSP